MPGGMFMSDNFVQRLREQRASAWEQAKGYLDVAATENRDLSAEENAGFDKANADIDAIDERVKSLEAAEQRSRDMDAAFDAITVRKPERAADADRDSDVRKFGRGELRAFEARPTVQELRDLTKGTSTSGGATLPTTFAGFLWAHLIETATVAGISTVINTDSGENFELPVTTGHSSAALTAENAAIAESDPAFVKRTLGAYKYGVVIQAPSELLSDTGVDLEGYLSMQAGRACGNAFGAHLVTGTGSAQPSGIVTGSTVGVTGAASVVGVFNADNLIDLFFSVIAPYRNSPSCGWLMKDSTLATVRKLKDTTNQYLWQPSVQMGVPDSLLGKPVYTDPNVPAPALSAKSVVFGDFSTYYTRIAGGIRFESSSDFAFNTDQITYRAIVRGDGILADQTGSVKVFQGNAA